MFASIWAGITAGFKATAAAFGYAQQRDTEQNTADQRSNATAAALQKIEDQANAAVDNPDQTAINRMTQP